MSKGLHVATSPLTGRVYCGNVLKSGDTWGANKTDVTGEACAAVAQHVLMGGGKTTITRDGQPAYELVVRELPANVAGNRLAEGKSELTGVLGGCNEEHANG